MFIISSVNTMINLNTNLKEKKALLFLDKNQIQLLTDSKIVSKLHYVQTLLEVITCMRECVYLAH